MNWFRKQKNKKPTFSEAVQQLQDALRDPHRCLIGERLPYSAAGKHLHELEKEVFGYVQSIDEIRKHVRDIT